MCGLQTSSLWAGSAHCSCPARLPSAARWLTQYSASTSKPIRGGRPDGGTGARSGRRRRLSVLLASTVRPLTAPSQCLSCTLHTESTRRRLLRPPPLATSATAMRALACNFDLLSSVRRLLSVLYSLNLGRLLQREGKRKFSKPLRTSSIQILEET